MVSEHRHPVPLILARGSILLGRCRPAPLPRFQGASNHAYPRVSGLSARSALVVFVGHADCRWLGFLRAGFRHCFVVVRDGGAWVTCDPLKDRIELSLLPLRPDFDLAAFYAGRGHTVLLGLTTPGRPRQPFGVAPMTCVTVVKRLLGVRAPWVVTPWQLCRHLRTAGSGFRDVVP